jgi:cyanophycinase-like exopeptidase
MKAKLPVCFTLSSHLKEFVFCAILLCISLFAQAQSYTSYFTGDTTNLVTAHTPGLVLAGGGTDNDNAMQWMLSAAAGGDVLIIRASGSDGYNNYFFSQLGVTLNSVETIRFNSAAASNDPYVIRRIREAEVLFMAGGDQYDYYQYWKDSPVEDAINYLIHDKKIMLGGTSAGMAILGKVYYAPLGSAVDSLEALNNPYHPDMTVLGRDDFVDHPWMTNTITDTHFDQRTRGGRTVTFMARMETDWGIDAFAIACNEYTAVGIDSTGKARAFGEWPTYSDVVYFMQSNCDQPVSAPENCNPGQALTWDKNGQAIKVYVLPGTVSGGRSFELSDWQTGNGGYWEDWSIVNGQLSRNQNATLPCTATDLAEGVVNGIRVNPNPFSEKLRLRLSRDWQGGRCEIRDLAGRLVWSGVVEGEETVLESGNWAAGMYLLRVLGPNGKDSSLKLLHR